MSLLNLITHTIIEDSNKKDCVVARTNALSVKANMVEEKPTTKRYEKKPNHKKKINFFVPMHVTPPLRKKECVLSVKG